ncbi:hypothetical protein CC86DRAFT_408827 [Ophiobolus disseminans]|uniref:Lipocalin-like domain-containing protein n=1 Tax=Ophiobolus disseminans TaxID=1469910 RepID=A0A6A6ZSJ5_9PLEO|nr:hypothetical protein CC86DRAFT_408827 [Ophiobolus disseminans]
MLSPLILALAAMSSASVLPRAQDGSWAVAISSSAYANGFSSQKVTANYTSSAYPAGIVSTCTEEYNPGNTPAATKGCDNEAFKFEYDGQTIKLQQNIELPTAQTVFGEGSLELKISDSVGRTRSGEAVVEVTSAIA